MIVTREGSTLKVHPETGISHYLTFSHTCPREADAEAWRVHFERAHMRQQDRRREELEQLRARIATLEKSRAALRGCLRRAKRR